MSPRVPIPSQDFVTWDFQVEKQSFITRYGKLGTQFFKQVVLQSGAPISAPGVKRISRQAYELAQRLATLKA